MEYSSISQVPNLAKSGLHKKIQNTKAKCGLVVYKKRNFWFMKGSI